MHKKYSFVFLKLLVVAICVVLFTVTWYIFYSNAIPFPFYRKGNWLIVVLYAFLYYVLCKQMGAFTIGTISAGDLIYSQILSILIVNVFTYFEISLIGRYWLSMTGMLLLTALQVACVIIWSIYSTHLYLRVQPPKSVVLLYDKVLNESIAAKFTHQKQHFTIQEYIDFNIPEPELVAAIQKYEAVILCSTEDRTQDHILKLCYGMEKALYIAPTVSDILVNGADKVYIFDSPLLYCRNLGLTATQAIVKRFWDFVLSLIGIAIASPFMLVIAIAIRMHDHGPIIYRQERLTLNGKKFEVYKFRTMRVDAESDGVARLSSHGDDRITKVGKVLRKLRLDELPQLLNILKGDLSIVGPRPERPELIEQYKQTLPEFDFRLKVKAGLTGYAQVLGQYSTEPQDKLLLDLVYIENYSLWLDFKIILLTIKTMFTPSSTE